MVIITSEPKEEDLHEKNIKSLIQEQGKLIKPEFIREVYLEILSRHEDATVRQFVPLIVMRVAKQALSQQKY